MIAGLKTWRRGIGWMVEADRRGVCWSLGLTVLIAGVSVSTPG